MWGESDMADKRYTRSTTGQQALLRASSDNRRAFTHCGCDVTNRPKARQLDEWAEAVLDGGYRNAPICMGCNEQRSLNGTCMCD